MSIYAQTVEESIRILEPVIESSHKAIRRWIQRLAPLCDRFDVDRRIVHTIFVDETMIRIRGRQAWVWVAFEPGLRVFLDFRVSCNQSVLDAYLFLKGWTGRYGSRANSHISKLIVLN